MSIKRRRIKLREMADTIRNYVNEELGASLSLQTCQVGSEFQYTAELSSDLPMVLVRLGDPVFSHHEQKGFLQARTPCEIGYFRELSDDDEPEVIAEAAREDLLELFTRDSFDWPFVNAPLSEGCIEQVIPVGASVVEKSDLVDISMRLEQVGITLEIWSKHGPE